MQGSLCAGVVQVQSGEDVPQNLAACQRQLLAAVERGARLIVLPENFAFFGAEAQKRQVAEIVHTTSHAEDGPILRFLREFAAQHQVTLIAGGMPERSEDAARPHNTALVVGPNADVVARYRKIHLFDVTLPSGQEYRESNATLPGEACVVVEVAGVRVGLAICYDLRFPELFRRLYEQGAQVFALGAAFTQTTGEAHWHVLMRARAIEWQSFMLGAAQSGSHPGGRLTYGHSLIIDPWGKVIAECVKGEGVSVAELDVSYVANVRESLPCAAHRRL